MLGPSSGAALEVLLRMRTLPLDARCEASSHALLSSLFIASSVTLASPRSIIVLSLKNLNCLFLK